MCQLDKEVIREKVLCSDINSSVHMCLPLHLILMGGIYYDPPSERLDCLRLSIRLYPEAAGINDGTGRTSYDHAILNEVSPYIQRLLLCADPNINPTELHRFNFEPRRMAVVANTYQIMYSRLRAEYKNLLRHHISFL